MRNFYKNKNVDLEEEKEKASLYVKSMNQLEQGVGFIHELYQDLKNFKKRQQLASSWTPNLLNKTSISKFFAPNNKGKKTKHTMSLQNPILK